MTFISTFLTYLENTIYKRTILVLIVLLCIGVSVALLSMSRLTLNLIESQAIENATLSIKALKSSHSLYSDQVIERIKTIPGIVITHDYLNQNNAIPPPITHTIELSDRLSNQQTGYLFRLYSDYPYPHRQKTGGVKDNFEQDALNFLRSNPNKAFFRQEEVQQRLTFRYAEAMIMKPSCVSCHNSHANSPKKDWQVGDVRGVIEIAQPIDKFILQTRVGLKDILVMLGGISTLGITGLALVIGKLRYTAAELESKVRSRTTELELIATSDGLTQASNRRHFNQVFSQEWQKMAQQRKFLSLILCDIDYFKLYNDRYGHLAGDNCLIKVTQAIAEVLSLNSSAGFLARYGGEEFAIILSDISLEDAMVVAEEIRQSVLALELLHEDSLAHYSISMSLGVSSIIPDHRQSSDILINTADKALYEAKSQGRNCSVSKQA